MLEKLLLGLKVALIGLVLVFVILYLLILAIRLLHAVVGGKGKSTVEKPAAPEVPVIVEETEDDGALVAAITAAVYACLAEEGANASGKHPEFVIRKIREIRR